MSKPCAAAPSRSVSQVFRKMFIAAAAAATLGAIAPAALAQREFAASQIALDKQSVRVERYVIRPSEMHNAAGASGGRAIGNRGPGCTSTTSSHTTANFAGDTFNAQGGFAQGEIAAASYTIPAASFPIKINLLEFVLAGQNLNTQTVTEWSVLVWEGNPNTGVLLADYSSDDLIVPHARVGPGTDGVNIQVSVDPNDPEQIFVFNNGGSNTFTIGLRIDRHNNQTANPCFTAPPSTSNAFPTTDTNGRSTVTQNWLFALDCGPFGCAAGWRTFQQLTVCSPSGDWVMRATWEPVNCGPATGACCNAGNCTISTQTLCSGGSAYQGDNTVCSPNPCPEPTGACCFSGGTCQVRTAASCAGFGGTYAGNSVACGPGGICPSGACCLPNGACVADQLATQCASQGGTLQGAGTTCSPTACPQPSGACCLTATGFCSIETEANCTGVPGAVWRGGGTACSAATCPNTGACCASTGFCSQETQSACGGIPGATFQGIGTACSPSPCSTGTGACCCGSSCTITTAAACSGVNRTFAGAGTSCTPFSNTAPCCRGDYNKTGGAPTVQDIFDFLSGYFGSDACADTNDTGGAPTVQDIFDYLSAYFGGGC